jgi:hypothetical protein
MENKENVELNWCVVDESNTLGYSSDDYAHIVDGSVETLSVSIGKQILNNIIKDETK